MTDSSVWFEKNMFSDMLCKQWFIKLSYYIRTSISEKLCGLLSVPFVSFVSCCLKRWWSLREWLLRVFTDCWRILYLAATAVLIVWTAALSWSYDTRPFMYLRRTQCSQAHHIHKRKKQRSRDEAQSLRCKLSTAQRIRNWINLSIRFIFSYSTCTYWGMLSNSGVVMKSISLT